MEECLQARALRTGPTRTRMGDGWGQIRTNWYDGEQVPQNVCKVLDDDTSHRLTDDDEDEEVTHGDSLYGLDEEDTEEDIN